MADIELYPGTPPAVEAAISEPAMTPLEHRILYGRAVLSAGFDRASNAIDHIRHPGRTLTLLGVTATAAAGIAAMPEGISQAQGYDQSARSASTKKYPNVMSASFQRKIHNLARTCLPNPLAVNTEHTTNDEPKKANENGKLWVKLINGGHREKVNWTYGKKGLTFCGGFVSTSGNGGYFVKPTKKTKRGGYYIDPHPNKSPNSLSSVVIFFKKRK